MKRWMKIGMLLIFIASFLANVFLFYKLYARSKSSENYSLPLLSSFSYFYLHSVDDYTIHQLFNMEDSRYIVYFYADGCGACEKANEYMAAFLNYGFTKKIDIYFVNITNRDDLLVENEDEIVDEESFGIVYTPTILVFDDQQISYYTGAEDVFAVLDHYVKEGTQ